MGCADQVSIEEAEVPVNSSTYWIQRWPWRPLAWTICSWRRRVPG